MLITMPSFHCCSTSANESLTKPPRHGLCGLAMPAQHCPLLGWRTICCAVITTGINGLVKLWRAPERRAKRKGVPKSTGDAKPSAPSEAVSAQPPLLVNLQDVKPEPVVRATSNSSRYRGVTRHRRDGGPCLNGRALHLLMAPFP